MSEPRIERNRVIREEYTRRSKGGEKSSAIFESLAGRFYLNYDTIRQIVYDKHYGCRHSKKSGAALIKRSRS